MKVLSALFIIYFAVDCSHVYASNDITEILNSSTNLSPEEVNGLRPLFEQLQTLYDFIKSELVKDGSSEPELDALVAATRHEFNMQFQELLFVPTRSIEYKTDLPTVEQLIGTPNTTDMSREEFDELLDMRSILEEALQEAQLNINNIVNNARNMEALLLKNIKKNVVTYLYKALNVFFDIAVKGSRAAYCTYSYIPALNSSLHSIYDGIDCYTNTTQLIVRIQNETLQSIKTIKKNVFDLAAIYKRISQKNSLAGKLFYLILNVTKIARDIQEAYSVVMQGMEALQSEVPVAVAKSVQCGKIFVASTPQMLETVSELSICIRFVDETTNGYDFLLPENERELYK